MQKYQYLVKSVLYHDHFNIHIFVRRHQFWLVKVSSILLHGQLLNQRHV